MILSNIQTFIKSTNIQLLIIFRLLTTIAWQKIYIIIFIVIITLTTNGCIFSNYAYQDEPSSFVKAIKNKSLVVDGESIFIKKEFFEPNIKSELVFYEFTVLDRQLSKDELLDKTEIKLAKNYLDKGYPNSKYIRLLYDDKKTNFHSLFKSYKQFNKIDWLKFFDEKLYIDEDNDENNLKDNSKANYLQINNDALSQDTYELAVYSLKYNDGSLRKYILPSIASKPSEPVVLTTAPISHHDIPNQEMVYFGDVFVFLSGASSEVNRRGYIIPEQEFNIKVVGNGNTKTAEVSAEIDLQQSLFMKKNSAFVDQENEKFDHISIKNFNFIPEPKVVEGVSELTFEGLTFLNTQNTNNTSVTNPYKVDSASYIFAGLSISSPEEFAVMMKFKKEIKDKKINFGDFNLTFGGKLKK